MGQVKEVKGGPIGLWNNRGRTDKVKKGDFVVKVRRAGQTEAQWVDRDAKLMLEVLMTNGPFEVEVKRATQQELEEPVQVEVAQVKEEVPDVEASAATVEAPPKAAGEEQQVTEVNGDANRLACGFCTY